MVSRSQREYDRRLHAVIDYIDRHLDQTLDLATLAGVAHFSDFHFHRLFHALTGEPLGDYVRRRRLELAAVRLRSQPAVPVLDVALGVGFGSDGGVRARLPRALRLHADAVAKEQARSVGPQGGSGSAIRTSQDWRQPETRSSP